MTGGRRIIGVVAVAVLVLAAVVLVQPAQAKGPAEYQNMVGSFRAFDRDGGQQECLRAAQAALVNNQLDVWDSGYDNDEWVMGNSSRGVVQVICYSKGPQLNRVFVSAYADDSATAQRLANSVKGWILPG